MKFHLGRGILTLQTSDSRTLDETLRGSGGFGSTGVSDKASCSAASCANMCVL